MRIVVAFFIGAFVSMSCAFLLAEEVPVEAIEGWKWLEQDLSTVNGTTSRDVANRKETIRFAFQGKLGKADGVQQSSQNESQNVTLFNESHSFQLAKNKDDKFILGSVADRNNDRRVRDVSSYIKVSVAIGSILLRDAINSKDFVFSDWKINEFGNCTCIVKCVSADPDRPFDTLFAEFDPKNHFRVTKSIATLSLPVPMTIERTPVYSDSSLPNKVTTKVQVGDRPPSTEETIYSDVSKSPLPKSEFTLSHYGLPEYAAPTEPWSLKFKILLFTAIFALSGLGIWFFKRNKP